MNDLESKLILSGDPSGALKALDKTNDAAKKLSKQVGSIGDASSQAARQLQDAFDKASRGGSGGGRGLNADKIKDVAGAFGDLDSALASMQGGALSAVSGVEQLVNAALSLGPIGIAGGIAVAGLAAAFAVLNQAQGEATKGMRELIDRTDEYYTLLVTGSQEDVQAAIDAKKQEIEITKARAKDLEEFQNLNETALGTIQREFARVTAPTFGGVNKNLIDAADAAFKASEDLTTLEKELRDLESILDEGATSANDAKAQLESLAEQEAEIAKTRESHITTLQSLRQQEADLIAAFEERKRIQAEDLALRKQRQQEDDALKAEFEQRKSELDALFESEDAAQAALQRQQQFQDRIVDIEEAGAQRIADLRQSIVDKTVQTNQQIQDAIADYNAQRIKDEDAFNREALQRQQEYERKRADIERSFNQTRLQAFARQDALSLYFAQLAKEDDLSDLDTDKQTADTEATEQFQREQAEAEAALQARLEAIRTEQAEFEQSVQAKIQVEQDAIQRRIEAERASFAEQERLLAESDTKRAEREQAYNDLQDELDTRRRELIESREKEDQAIRERREQESLDKQLDKIEEKKDAEIEALDELTYKAIELKQIAQSIQFPAGNSILELQRQMFQGTYGGGSPKPLPPPGSPTPFATGGMFTQPTRMQDVLFGEAEEEYLIPQSRMNEFGNTSISVPISLNVAGGMGDESQLMNAIVKVLKPELETVLNGVAQTLRQQRRPK